MLDMHQIFNRDIVVPNVGTFDELASVLRHVRAFDDEADLSQSLNELRDITGSDRIGLGIKKVLNVIDEAKQERENVPSLFAEILAGRIASAGE